MEVDGQDSDPEPMDVDVNIVDAPGPAGNMVLSPADLLKLKRKEHFMSLNSNWFDTDLFMDNTLVEASKEFHCELEKTSWSTCTHCTEKYICMAVRPRSSKCEQCTRNPQLFFKGECSAAVLQSSGAQHNSTVCVYFLHAIHFYIPFTESKSFYKIGFLSLIFFIS